MTIRIDKDKFNCNLESLSRILGYGLKWFVFSCVPLGIYLITLTNGNDPYLAFGVIGIVFGSFLSLTVPYLFWTTSVFEDVNDKFHFFGWKDDEETTTMGNGKL